MGTNKLSVDSVVLQVAHEILESIVKLKYLCTETPVWKALIGILLSDLACRSSLCRFDDDICTTAQYHLPLRDDQATSIVIPIDQ